MTVLSRRIPKMVRNRSVTPFKITIPRELGSTEEDIAIAMDVYTTLKKHNSIKLHDPFFILNVSSIFIGNYYGTKGRDKDLNQVVRKMQPLQDKYPVELADTFVEYDVPAAMEDDVPAETLTPINPDLGLIDYDEVPPAQNGESPE